MSSPAASSSLGIVFPPFPLPRGTKFDIERGKIEVQLVYVCNKLRGNFTYNLPIPTPPLLLPPAVPLHNVGVFHHNGTDLGGFRQRLPQHGGREDFHHLPDADGV